MSTLTVDEYAQELLGTPDDLTDRMRAEAEARNIPMIQVPPELGRLLTVLVAASGARRVLEIGTLFGFSGILLARALPENGSLTTLEVNPTHAAVARANFERAGVAGKVRLIEGEAAVSLRSLEGEMYDLVFIDADKPGYPHYLDAVLQRVHPGSIIVADNVWRGGTVLDAPEDPGNAALGEYGRRVAGHHDLVSTLVPTRGGGDAALVTVVRRPDAG